MSQLQECSYKFGLWREDLQTGLAWYVGINNAFDSGFATQPAITPIHCQASGIPTWSWASRWGKYIRFPSWETNAVLMVSEGLSSISVASNFGTPDLPNNSSGMRFGLTISGLVRKAFVELIERNFVLIDGFYSPLSSPAEARWRALVRDPNTGKELGYIALDSDPTIEPVDEIFCLLCTTRVKHSNWQLTCIALVPTENEREYRRVGLVRLMDSDWFGPLVLKEPNKFLNHLALDLCLFEVRLNCHFSCAFSNQNQSEIALKVPSKSNV
jgi:hypothetical protein